MALVWRLKKRDPLTALSTVADRKCLINVSKVKTNKILGNIATSFLYVGDQTYENVIIQVNVFFRLKFY